MKKIMIRKLGTLLSAVCLLFISTAYAHDGANHGKPVEGTIKSLATDSLVLKTDKGDQTVTLLPETVYVGETEEQKVSKSDLLVGRFLMIYGTKLESEELVAKEIMIHGVKDSAEKSDKHMH